MPDLITPVIVAVFGGLMALIVAGFYFLIGRRTDSPIGTRDYYPRARSGFSRGDPFRRKGFGISPNRRALAVLVITILLVVAAVASTLTGTLDLFLLLIFFTPFIFGLLRNRRKERDEEGRPDDERRRST